MRINIIRFSELGGVNTVSNTLVNGLQKDGHQINVIEIAPPKTNIIYRKIFRHLPRTIKSAIQKIRINKLSAINEINNFADVNIFTHPFLLLTSTCPAPPTQTILWYHDSYSAAKNNGHLEQIIFAKPLIDKLIVLSEEDSIRFQQKTKIASFSIPNSIPEVHFENFQLSRDKNFVMLTRHEYQKNIPLAIKAWNKSMAPQLGFRLKIYGQGSDFRKNLKLAQKFPGTIDFFQPTATPIEILQSSAALLSSSRHEGFPATFIEAMSCGTPIISVNSSPGVKKLVLESGGVLCRGNSSKSLAEAINKFVNLDQVNKGEMMFQALDIAKNYLSSEVTRQWDTHLRSNNKHK